ncbi:3-isopropylmalate dehydratase small subunit 3-like protein [Carex littledalei]|uniref:3-isopropylmalate dehydratase n=1 Tax=Carex littledalei TaxID=544730 RepID=A0A833QID3_9POAL|nr:3-isopropylmalate dehydratase small subunit 3-like protein [Carex littledalei]
MATTQAHAPVSTIRASFQRLHSPTKTQLVHFASNPFIFAKFGKTSFSYKPSTIKPLTTPRATPSSSSPTTFHGQCYVLGDNIDTDQIIPAEHLTLVPSKTDEYKKLGSFAFSGLPSSLYPIPFIEPGTDSTRYSIIIAGANFGCGSSREHAPVALGAAGVRAVVAESYARIFFRNSVATGEVYPLELELEGVNKQCSTGDVVTIDLGKNLLINHTKGKEFVLKPIGDAGPVIDAGGIFAYARKTGMISSVS